MERPSPTRGKISALPRSRLPPANVQVNGHSPAPPAFGHPGATPSGRKQQGLLQTLSKVEQESEDRAFEIIKLRVGQSRQNPVLATLSLSLSCFPMKAPCTRTCVFITYRCFNTVMHESPDASINVSSTYQTHNNLGNFSEDLIMTVLGSPGFGIAELFHTNHARQND